MCKNVGKKSTDTEMCYVLRSNLIHDTLNQGDTAMKRDEKRVAGVPTQETQNKHVYAVFTNCTSSF